MDNIEDSLTSDKMNLDAVEYRYFKGRYSAGDFQKQRLGQAFYNHFKLEKLSNQKSLKNLYEAEDTEANKIINELFIFV